MSEESSKQEGSKENNPLKPDRRGFLKTIASIATTATGNSPLIKTLDSIAPASTLYPPEILPYLKLAAEYNAHLHGRGVPVFYSRFWYDRDESVRNIDVSEVVNLVIDDQERLMPMLNYIQSNPHLKLEELFKKASNIYYDIRDKSFPDQETSKQHYYELVKDSPIEGPINAMLEWEKQFQNEWFKKHQIDKKEYELMAHGPEIDPTRIESKIIERGRDVGWILARYISQRPDSNLARQEVREIIDSAYTKSSLPPDIINKSKKTLWNAITNDIAELSNLERTTNFSKDNSKSHNTEATNENKHTYPDAMKTIAEGYGKAADMTFGDKEKQRRTELPAANTPHSRV